MGDGESDRRAMVTGATRGIGKATALALARSGWDVAISGRTVHEGEGRDTSDTGGGRPLPGSLDATAAAVRDLGRRALPLVADLHDLEAVRAAAAALVDEWGGVDLLVNNAVDTGPGSMVPVLELTVEELQGKLAANVVAQMATIKTLLPGMLADAEPSSTSPRTPRPRIPPARSAAAAGASPTQRPKPPSTVSRRSSPSSSERRASAPTTSTRATSRPNASRPTPRRSDCWAGTRVHPPRCRRRPSRGWSTIPKRSRTGPRSERSNSPSNGTSTPTGASPASRRSDRR